MQGDSFKQPTRVCSAAQQLPAGLGDTSCSSWVSPAVGRQCQVRDRWAEGGHRLCPGQDEVLAGLPLGGFDLLPLSAPSGRAQL